MAKVLPAVPLVTPFTLAPPGKPSKSRMAAIWGIGTIASGALFAATCDRSLCTPAIGFRDGVIVGGGVFMPALIWAALRENRKAANTYNVGKNEHERLIATRDSAVMQRLRMLDSAHEAETRRIQSLRPVRSITFDQGVVRR